jgi:hypothetical protein
MELINTLVEAITTNFCTIAASTGLLLVLLRTDAVRDGLKGKISSAKCGKLQTWKKDGDPAIPSDSPPFWVGLDKVKWG